MVENMDEFDHDASTINADQSVHIRYANVQDGTIRLQFTTVGTDVGHYDLLNIERANHEPVSPVTQRVPVTMISPIPKRKRKQRSNDTSIVLTASPYKTQLTNKTPRDKTRVQRQKKPNVRGNKVGENKKGKKQKSKSRSSSDPSWVCSLCGDCSVESMICCVKCQNWVHVACADQYADMITYTVVTYVHEVHPVWWQDPSSNAKNWSRMHEKTDIACMTKKWTWTTILAFVQPI